MSLRSTLLALSAVALLAGCEQPTGTAGGNSGENGRRGGTAQDLVLAPPGLLDNGVRGGGQRAEQAAADRDVKRDRRVARKKRKRVRGKPRKVLGETTGEVFEAEEELRRGAVVKKRPVVKGDPITISISALKLARFRAAEASVKSGLDAFFAENFRYPRNYEEFKTGVIDKYNIRLPELPYFQEYGYDAKKRELVILEYPELKKRGR